jgi:hypothetical protein
MSHVITNSIHNFRFTTYFRERIKSLSPRDDYNGNDPEQLPMYELILTRPTRQTIGIQIILVFWPPQLAWWLCGPPSLVSNRCELHKDVLLFRHTHLYAYVVLITPKSICITFIFRVVAILLFTFDKNYF